MGLDYSQGCVNFRDVGEFVNLIANRHLLPEKRLLRGGKLDSVQSADDICNPRTIVNLRKSAETILFEAIAYNFPISNDYEKYDTGNREVQRWLNKGSSIPLQG